MSLLSVAGKAASLTALCLLTVSFAAASNNAASTSKAAAPSRAASNLGSAAGLPRPNFGRQARPEIERLGAPMDINPTDWILSSKGGPALMNVSALPTQKEILGACLATGAARISRASIPAGPALRGPLSAKGDAEIGFDPTSGAYLINQWVTAQGPAWAKRDGLLLSCLVGLEPKAGSTGGTLWVGATLQAW